MNLSSTFSKLLGEKTNNLIIQLFRYTIVGGLAFIVDYGLLCVLTEFAGLHYLISATISFIAGLVVNYVISTKWVFEKSDIKNKSLEFIAYALVGIIGLGLNNLFLYVFTDLIGIYYALSKPITAVLVYAWNFFARRFLIFNSKQS